MQLVRGLHNFPSDKHACALTIGNFDGLHKGHQAVLRGLREYAVKFQLMSSVMTFEPTPQEYFSPATAPARLQRLRDKLSTLAEMQIDQVICLPFNQRLAKLSADDFVQQVLIDGLDVRFLVVGDDFRFGKDRQGDLELLTAYGKRTGFEVVSTQTFIQSDGRVSSTRVREALANGDLQLAERLLGRPFRICGKVASGQQRGRTIGFPTANIRLHRKVTPLKGVYAVRVEGAANDTVVGVANLGTRPTVDGKSWMLEVHLFDFSSDIYGRVLDVEFCSRIRDEKKFESFDALKVQIQQDAQVARDYFEQL